MAGIGEAASIWAFASSAWSFAEAITQYAKDFKGVPEELEGLDGEIRDTVSLVSELRDLVHKNEVTKCWSDEGIRRAQKCIVDCQGVLGTLRNLLQKAGVSTEVEITKEDLDIGLLVQAKWPIAYKQQLTDARAKLDRVYTRIQIAQTSYLIPTMPTRVEKERSMKTLAQLLRSEEEAGKREILRKQARKKQKQKQKQSQRRHSLYSDAGPSFKAYSQSSTAGGHSRVQSYYDGSIYASSPDSSENEDNLTAEKRSTMYEEFCKDLLQMARDELAVEEAEKAAKERALQEQRQAAIHAYQDYVRQQRTSRELKRQELRAQLDGKLAATQVDDIVALQYPDIGEDEDPQAALVASRVNAKKLPATPASNLDESLPVLTKTQTKAKVTPAPRGAGSFSSKFKRMFSGKNNSMDRTGANAIPLDLQEILSPSGKARLKGFVIGSNGDDKMKPTDFDVPESWLLKRLSERGKSGIRKSGSHYSPWDEFALLPQSYRRAIDNVMYEQAAEGFSPYSLLYVERIFEEKRRSLFGRRQIPELKAVYVVLKPRSSSTPLDWPQSDIGRLDGTAKERPYQVSVNQPQDQLPSKSINDIVFERDDSKKDNKSGSNAGSEPFEKRVTDFIKSSSKRLNGAEADRGSNGPSYPAHGQQTFPNDVKPASSPVYMQPAQYPDLTSTGRYAPPGFYPQAAPPMNTHIPPLYPGDPGIPQYYTGLPPSDPYASSALPRFTSPVSVPNKPLSRPTSRSHVHPHLPNMVAAESRPPGHYEGHIYAGVAPSVNGRSATGPYDHTHNPPSSSVYDENLRSKYEYRSRRPIRQSSDGTSRSRDRDAYSTIDSNLYTYLSSGSSPTSIQRTRRGYSGDSYNTHSPIVHSPIDKDAYWNGKGESKHRKTNSDNVRLSTTQLNKILASKATSNYRHPTTETVVDASSEEEIVSRRRRPRLRFDLSDEDTTIATKDNHLKPHYPSHSKKHHRIVEADEIESPLELDFNQSASLPDTTPRVDEDEENEWWGAERPEKRAKWQSQSAQSASADLNRVATNMQQSSNSKVAESDSGNSWSDKSTVNDKDLAARYLSGLVNHEITNITNGTSPTLSVSQNRQPIETTTDTREGNQTPQEGEDVSLLRSLSSSPFSASKPNTSAGQEKNVRDSASYTSANTTLTSKARLAHDAANNLVNHMPKVAAVVTAAAAPVASSSSSVGPLEQPPPSLRQSGEAQAGTDDRAGAGDTESTTTEGGRAAVNGRVTDLSAPRYRPSELVEMLSAELTEPPRRADSSTVKTEKEQEVDSPHYATAAEAARLRLEEQSRCQTSAQVELELLKIGRSNSIRPRSSSGASVSVSIPGSVAASLTASHGPQVSAITATTSSSARQVSSPSFSGSTELGVNASSPDTTISGSNAGAGTDSVGRAGTTAAAAADTGAGARPGPGSGLGSRNVSSSTVMRRRSAGSEDEW